VGFSRPCEDPPSLVVQGGTITPHQRGLSSDCLARVNGGPLGRWWVDWIPVCGFLFRLGWYACGHRLCALGHPVRGCSRGACFVLCWWCSLGEFGCQLGHFVESLVELVLPCVPGSDLESIAGTEYNYFSG